MRPAAVAAAAVAALTAGCTLITDSFLTNDFSGDPFPILVDTSSGAVMVGLRQAARPDREVVLDVLAPLTVTDAGPTSTPSVSYVDLELMGAAGPGGALDRPRARFIDAQVLALHPCTTDPCSVGPATAPRPYEGILGADLLAGDALRLRLGDDQVFLLPDVAGDNAGRARACDATFNSPFRGGGTLVVGGTELPFGNRRITVQACLGPDPDPAPGSEPVMTKPQSQRGADALLVVSTAIGISLLGEASYERYRIAHPAAAPPPLAALPADAAFLPSGLVTGRRATLAGIALVGAPSGNDLAPCRQVYAHQLMTLRDCRLAASEQPDPDCPCGTNAFCPVPGVLELTPPAGIDVLVVPDSDPTLQALRTELRPNQPEVDGILGATALRAAEIDVDYPHDRLVARCTAGSGACTARPQLLLSDDAEGRSALRADLTSCLAAQPTGPILPGS